MNGFPFGNSSLQYRRLGTVDVYVGDRPGEAEDG